MRMRRRHRQTVAGLLADGRLERVTPDLEEARDLLSHAFAHLGSARLIVDGDPAGA